MSSAFSLFHNIIKAGHRPTASTLNYLLQGLCDRGQISKAIIFFNYSILKGFELDDRSYDILIHGLCGIGEIKMATHLLRQRPCEHDTCFGRTMVVYAKVISRLCEDRLVNEAYALFSEIVVKNKKNRLYLVLYHRLIYGYCITGQFKQAIAMFRELKAIENINTSTCIPTLELVIEHEVKAAKRALSVLIKRGVQPHLASYQSVVGGLYRGGRVKVARKVEELSLQFCKPFLEKYHYCGS
jgi:pentatricopeptide repeat domain-containing protein 1